MTETPHDRDPGAASLALVRAAIAELGEATAAAVGAHAGLAYSTTTPKLRALEDAGLAERFRTDDNRTLWRLTDTGHAAGPAGTHSNATEPGEPAKPATAGTGTAAATDAASTGNGGEAPDVTDVADTAAAAVDPVSPPSAAPDGISTATNPATGGDGIEAEVPQNDQPDQARTSTARRAKGTLDGAVLDVLEAEPNRSFKVSEICKLIDKTNEGSRISKASAGAVVLAAHRLVRQGRAVLAVEHPASFQLHPPT